MLTSTPPRQGIPDASPKHVRPCVLASVRWTWFVHLVTVAVLCVSLLVGFSLNGDSGRSQAVADPVSHGVATSSAPATAPTIAGVATIRSRPSPNSAARSRARTDATSGGPASALAVDGIPTTALEAYQDAAARELRLRPSCGISWALLAAIGRVESDHNRFGGAVLHTDGLATPPVIGPALDGHGTALIRDTDDGALDGDRVYDHAVGPMQFIPSTWARFGVDGDGDGRADPFDIFDAAAAAADYLCYAGGDLTTAKGQRLAVFSYNHSDTYVAEVLALEQVYANGGVAVPVVSVPAGPVTVGAAPDPVTTLPPVNPGPPPAITSGPTPPTGSSSPLRGPTTAPSSPARSSCAAPSSTDSATEATGAAARTDSALPCPSPTPVTGTAPVTGTTPVPTTPTTAGTDPTDAVATDLPEPSGT